MDASKLTVNPEAIRLNKMSFKKRSALRRQNILDLINSKPFGTPITLEEFAAVAQLTGPAVHSLLATMVKNGIITKDKITHFKIAYAVTGAVHTIAAPRQKPTLESLAREYAWKHDTDSLRGFIKWMNEQELSVRRMVDGGGY